MAGVGEFPCVLTLQVPFPTARLASIAARSLQVDKELSPLVQRKLRAASLAEGEAGHAECSVLHVEYRATTNRMLRVAVNNFMDSLNLVIEVMEELDTHVLAAQPAPV